MHASLCEIPDFKVCWCWSVEMQQDLNLNFYTDLSHLLLVLSEKFWLISKLQLFSFLTILLFFSHPIYPDHTIPFLHSSWLPHPTHNFSSPPDSLPLPFLFWKEAASRRITLVDGWRMNLGNTCKINFTNIVKSLAQWENINVIRPATVLKEFSTNSSQNNTQPECFHFSIW